MKDNQDKNEIVDVLETVHMHDDAPSSAGSNPAPVPDQKNAVPTGKGKKPRKKISCLVIILIIIAALIVLGIFFGPRIFLALQMAANVYTPFEVTEEKLAELSPIPEEEAAFVDAMEAYSPEDTWSVYVYLIGSDLESKGMDNLSPLIQMLSAEKINENRTAKNEQQTADIQRFVQEVTSQGVDLPSVLYEPVANTTLPAGSIKEDDPDEDGFASKDFAQMTSVKLPEQVKLVVQTGGARRWQNQSINPNRTQRFLLDQNGVKEVYSVPALEMSDPDNLADFLSWSIEQYPADHSMVLFWDHGGASGGYGVDEIFGSMLSLKDLHNALEKAVGYDPENPYFEAIGFDACLMAGIENAHELHGFAKYLLASEESEPGSGWNHEAWLSALAEHPEMNGAQLGKVITDSYLDASNQLYAEIGYVSAGTFSVIDMNAGEAVYQAYAELIKEALPAVIKNPGYLTSLTGAANRSVFYARNSYRAYNTIDLGMFMDNLPEPFLESGKAVKEQLKKAVLYHRGSGYLSESQGMSVYYPARIEGFGGLSSFLNYINHVSDNKDINALYYYKVAGCLNEELQDHVREAGYGEAKVMDYSILRGIADIEVKANEEGHFTFSLSDEMMDLIQDARLEIAMLDEESGKVTYYGEDRDITMSDDNTFVAVFTGSWLMINDTPLATDLIDSTDGFITYSVPMLYNLLTEVNFMLSYHIDTQQVDFIGIRSQENEADLLGRDLIPLKPDTIVVPLYETRNLKSNSRTQDSGDLITIDEKTNFGFKTLADGTYLAYGTIQDLRSDKYYTPIYKLTIKDGKISETALFEDQQMYNVGKE